MFEGIRHISSDDATTNASYRSGEVLGAISFQATPHRVCVMSSVGPDAAVRECAISHYLSSLSNRWRKRTAEDVVDLS